MGVVGRHKEAIALEGMPRLVMFSRIHFAEEILCLLATALPKAAILYVYWRVFVGRCRLAIAVAAFFVFGVFISGLFSAFFACSPSEAVWDVSVTPDHCIDVNAFYRWIGVPNTMTDVAILVIPLPIVWRLHAATEQKISLTFAFFTGSMYVTLSSGLFIVHIYCSIISILFSNELLLTSTSPSSQWLRNFYRKDVFLFYH